ncbi:hypothetical protein OV203_33635 [Nannocystis sp. ILAH1]|uniref:hypothetical protein n=1 Tax=Nannocystis sp. ILAH1 TaxID=2996789 RepID=UPI0022704DA7|nr:hypothetical protein [Nannocystis sp. ILAH1]MCY0992128.1 hypothetical protein [Nannocystis sp. ILAH1]
MFVGLFSVTDLERFIHTHYETYAKHITKNPSLNELACAFTSFIIKDNLVDNKLFEHLRGSHPMQEAVLTECERCCKPPQPRPPSRRWLVVLALAALTGVCVSAYVYAVRTDTEAQPPPVVKTEDKPPAPPVVENGLRCPTHYVLIQNELMNGLAPFCLARHELTLGEAKRLGFIMEISKVYEPNRGLCNTTEEVKAVDCVVPDTANLLCRQSGRWNRLPTRDEWIFAATQGEPFVTPVSPDFEALMSGVQEIVVKDGLYYGCGMNDRNITANQPTSPWNCINAGHLDPDAGTPGRGFRCAATPEPLPPGGDVTPENEAGQVRR